MSEEQKELKRKAKEQTEKLHKKLKAAAGGGSIIIFLNFNIILYSGNILLF